MTRHGRIQVNIEADGRMRISAPSTPWHELDLSDSFMNAIATAPTPPKRIPIWKKRRMVFVIGGLMGLFFGCVVHRSVIQTLVADPGATCSWLFTEGDPLAA